MLLSAETLLGLRMTGVCYLEYMYCCVTQCIVLTIVISFLELLPKVFRSDSLSQQKALPRSVGKVLRFSMAKRVNQ